MASRAQQASSAERRQSRLAALAVIEGEALPLPTEPRDQPIEYTPDLAAECVLLGGQGLSEAQIAAHWAVDVETVRRWAEAHTELKAAMSRARTSMKAWWEERSRRAIITGDNRFPAGAWAQVMRARFSEYDDKTTLQVQLDLRQLVVLDLRSPELPDQQTVGEAKPLTKHASGQLGQGQTAGHTLIEGSFRPLVGPSEGEAAAPDPARREGVGAKPRGRRPQGGSR